MAERTPRGGVQGQTLDGPTLGVGLGPDLDQADALTVFYQMAFFFYFARSLCKSTGQANE